MESIEDFSFRNYEKLKEPAIKTKSVEKKDKKKTPLDRLFSGVKNNDYAAKDIFQSDNGKRYVAE